MPLFAIGDIHGCLYELDSLLDEIRPTRHDTIISLGDIIDRGPDSKGVIERLIALKKNTNLIMLRGNHEQLMLDARFDEVAFLTWMRNGGQDMLQSYGKNTTLLDIPTEHILFIERPATFYHETATHIFVHGGLDPQRDMPDQLPTTLLWARLQNQTPHKSGKIVVCGHTPQMSGRPAHLGHLICIDTAPFLNGPLTALNITSGEVLQAYAFGNVMKSHLNEYR